MPNTIVFTPNGKAIAGGYHASHKKDPDVTGFHGVIEWDVNTGKEITRYETPRITDGALPVAHALAYTPDGKWLIIGGGEAEQNAPGKSTLYGYLWLFNRQTAKLEKTLLADDRAQKLFLANIVREKTRRSDFGCTIGELCA